VNIQAENRNSGYRGMAMNGVVSAGLTLPVIGLKKRAPDWQLEMT